MTTRVGDFNFAQVKSMDDNSIVESGWNVWVWLVGVVSRRRVSVVGVGEIYGCGYWVWL